MKYHDLADFIGWLRYRLDMMKHYYAITKYNIIKYNARNKKQRLPQLGPLKNSFVQKFLSQCLHQSTRNLCGQICLSKVYTKCSIRFSTCFLRPSFSSEACANDGSARNCCTICKILWFAALVHIGCFLYCRCRIFLITSRQLHDKIASHQIVFRILLNVNILVAVFAPSSFCSELSILNGFNNDTTWEELRRMTMLQKVIYRGYSVFTRERGKQPKANVFFGAPEQ